jgi:hypothetical protein
LRCPSRSSEYPVSGKPFGDDYRKQLFGRTVFLHKGKTEGKSDWEESGGRGGSYEFRESDALYKPHFGAENIGLSLQNTNYLDISD